MVDSERYKPGNYEEQGALLEADQIRTRVINELIDSVPEEDPDRESIQEILREAVTFTDEDSSPVHRQIYFDKTTGGYCSNINIRFTNLRWLNEEYRRKVGKKMWNKAYQYCQNYFENKMRET